MRWAALLQLAFPNYALAVVTRVASGLTASLVVLSSTQNIGAAVSLFQALGGGWTEGMR